MGKTNPFTNGSEYEEWFVTNDKIMQSELAAVRELLPLTGKGIEIGVGTGIFASKLKIHYGIEPSEPMAEQARKKGINVLIGSAEDLPVEDGAFDHALMVTVDPFLNDIVKSFREIYRILRAEGSFVIAILDKAAPMGKIYDANKLEDPVYQYADFHSAEEIISYLNEAGFEVTDQRQTIFTMDNTFQESKNGTGEGLFAVLRAQKRPIH